MSPVNQKDPIKHENHLRRMGYWTDPLAVATPVRHEPAARPKARQPREAPLLPDPFPIKIQQSTLVLEVQLMAAKTTLDRLILLQKALNSAKK